MMKKSVVVLAFSCLGVLAFAGSPTLKSITVDGDMSDWAPVLANPIQVTIDGATAYPCNAGSPVDRDCPVQSTGRDLVKFAWTYDSANIFLYVERVGSSSNTQVFFFAMDVGQDRRMDASDYVLVVNWQGRNRSTGIVLYSYVPADQVNGDSLVDASGFADGYSLPGSIGSAAWWDYTKSGGGATGSEMESYVPWSELGVPAGTPVLFHVSSSNNTKMNTAQDNLGGPGGGIGAFGFHQHLIFPNNEGSTAPGGMVSYSHTLSNTGTFPDTYTITVGSSMGYGLTLTIDGVPASTGDTVPLAAGASATLGVDVSTTALPPSAIDTTTVSATSAGDGSSLSATDTTYVGSVSLAPDGSANGVPGMSTSYTHNLTNLLTSDLFNFTASSSAGFRLDLYDGSTLMATDLTGDGSWDSISPGYDSDGNGLPDLQAANGTSRSITLVVGVPAGTAAGTIDTAVLGATGATNGGSATVTDTTTVRPRLVVTPSYLISNGTNLYSGAGYPVYFAHTLVNSAPQADTFNFYAPGYTPLSTMGYAVTIVSDPNGDGNPSDGSPITSTGLVGANGGVFHFIVEVDIPLGVTPPATDSTTVTAVRCADAGCALSDTTVTGSVTDETKVSYIVPFMEAIHAVQRSAYPPCGTVYVGGFNLVANTYYTLVYVDDSGAVVRNVLLLADTNSTLSDMYTFPPSATGNWTVTLKDAGGADLDSVSLSIQRNATVSVQPSRAGLPLTGASAVADALLTNTNSLAAYEGSRVTYVVKDAGGTQYLKPDGTFAPFTTGNLTASHPLEKAGPGNSLTDTLAVASVTFPDYGVYTICATWEAACGSDTSAADDLDSSCADFLVVSWNSFADAGRTTPQSSFEVPAPAYFEGRGYGNGRSYLVALYGPSGALFSTTPVTSGASGLLDWNADTTVLSVLGSYETMVYPSGTAVPAVFNGSDPAGLSSRAFTVTLSPPSLTGPVLDGDTTAWGTSSAPVGSLVTLFVNGSSAGTGTVQVDGTFTVTVGSPFVTGDILTAAVHVGSGDSAPSTPLTVSPPVSLLRYGGITQLSPLSPSSAQIFVQQYPADPALDPSRDLEVAGFASGASFPHESTDLQSGSPSLVFYEISGVSGNTLRMSKGSGKIVITY